jgi:hypothetical protein
VGPLPSYAQESHVEENRWVAATGYIPVVAGQSKRRNWYENCLLVGLERVRMRSLALARLLFACCWLALSAEQTRPIKSPVIDGREFGFAHAPR